MILSTLLLTLGGLYAAPVGSGASAAERERQRPRPNDASLCPYCGGDPARMAAGGIVSHGGFEFATTDTAGIDGLLAAIDVHWIETEHFEIGLGLGPYRVGQDEREKIRAELTELQAAFPEIQPKTRTIDPWLRTHLYALRAEKAYRRFLEIMRVEQSEFPDGETPWLLGTPYRGEGPHLGQKGKYEVLVVPSKALHVFFLRDQFGLSIEMTQRWNVIDRDTLIVSIHQEQGLKDDQALHGHFVFNVTLNLLDGYEHYSYDTARWISEGLAHFVERELSPRYNTFDSSEGAVAETTRKSDWAAEVRSMIQAGDAPRMAELVALKTYAQFELRHHFATWSMTCFLIQEHPEAYACLNERIHGAKNAEGFPDATNLDDQLREAFQDCLGTSYAQFDAAWSEWALRQ